MTIQRSFDDMGVPLSEVTFCVIDLETTGGSARDCAITEIGAAKYRYGEEIGVFQTLVDPGRQIPAFITVLTGITQSMVLEAPTIHAALPALLEFVGDAVIVGHNIRFDMSFIQESISRLDYQRLTNRTVDTIGLARRLVRPEVRNLKLATLAAHFRSPVTPTHRALDDARATAYVLWGLLERAGSLGVTALEDLIQLPTAKGAKHYGKIHMTDDLPRRPGVYLFKDRNGTIFYIGKATNLRSRVRSYFYGDTRKSITNMMRELDDIEYRVCESTLEAEITELRLIHAHRPRHNRRSRPPKASHFVTLTKEAFPRLSVVRRARTGSIHLGPFRSKRTADLVKEAIWDAVPVRRCTNKPGSRSALCGMAQLGIAMCPCDGRLTMAEYAPVIRTIERAIMSQPELLLESLADRVRSLAIDQRFEEAAASRDRHRALAQAIERRRTWLALQAAGVLEVESCDGEAAVIDHGRFVQAWPSGMHPPLRSTDIDLAPESLDVPEDVLIAEEAHLLWKWITRAGTRLIDIEGALVSPASAVPYLESVAV